MDACVLCARDVWCVVPGWSISSDWRRAWAILASVGDSIPSATSLTCLLQAYGMRIVAWMCDFAGWFYCALCMFALNWYKLSHISRAKLVVYSTNARGKYVWIAIHNLRIGSFWFILWQSMERCAGYMACLRALQLHWDLHIFVLPLLLIHGCRSVLSPL